MQDDVLAQMGTWQHTESGGFLADGESARKYGEAYGEGPLVGKLQVILVGARISNVT